MSYFSVFAAQVKTPAIGMFWIFLHQDRLSLSEYIIPLLVTTPPLPEKREVADNDGREQAFDTLKLHRGKKAIFTSETSFRTNLIYRGIHRK